MSKENAPKIRQREAEKARREKHDIVTSLPQDVLSVIASFQTDKDRLSFFTTCHSLVKIIEAQSERSLKDMSRHADDTWEERIAETDDVAVRPCQLSYRYLLWKAHRTPLYQLRSKNGREWRCCGLHAMPDGQLLSCSNNCIVRMWNLSTRESTTPFGRYPANMFGNGDCLVSGDFVVCSLGFIVVVHRLNDGERTHRVISSEGVGRLAATKNKVFFTKPCSVNDTIASLDLRAGKIENTRLKWSQNAGRFDIVALDDDTLIVLRVDSHQFVIRGQVCGGIWIIDTETHIRKDFVAGGYHSIAKALDNSKMVVAARGSFIDVFKLQSDKLILQFSFSRSKDGIARSLNDILLVYRSLVYVRIGECANNTIDVYNGLNGDLVQTLSPSSRVVRVPTNGKQIFFGYHDESRGIGASIETFPLPKRPRLSLG